MSGKVNLSTELAPKSAINQAAKEMMTTPATNVDKDKETTEKTEQQQEQSKLMLAKYVCVLKSIQVEMLRGDATKWKEDDFVKIGVDSDTERGHILQPLDIDISIDLSLAPSGKFKCKDVFISQNNPFFFNPSRNETENHRQL